MEQFIKVEIFQKKVIPFEVLPFSCSYENYRIFLSFVWTTSARLHVERK